jgi:predicted acyl esterase
LLLPLAPWNSLQYRGDVASRREVRQTSPLAAPQAALDHPDRAAPVVPVAGFPELDRLLELNFRMRIGIIEKMGNDLDSEFWRMASARWDRITVPLYSVGNWGGFSMHLRGNTEAFMCAASRHKKLRIHTGTHFHPFHSEEGRLDQLRWMDYWLKGLDSGILEEPPVKLEIRTGGSRRPYAFGFENEWPLARTQWTKLYLRMGQQGDPVPCVTKGRLRASHRKLDAARSLPHRPYHAHDERLRLAPGEVVECQVGIWPTSMVFQKGHKLRLDISPVDGVGSLCFTHFHADYNFGAANTVHAGGRRPSYLLLPVIPA